MIGLAVCATVAAQYPRISSEVAADADRRNQTANERSDAAWAQAQPAIIEWAARGKPYLPDADEPGDLPQAPIPASP